MASTVFWFRKGLRLRDNPTLIAALEGSTSLFPVFVLDPWFTASGKVGAIRMRFLLESLSDLDRSLRKRNSQLMVLRGSPQDELGRMFKQYGITRLAFEKDTEPYAQQRDRAVIEMAEAANIEVVTRTGHTLCDPEAVLACSKGVPSTTYDVFRRHLATVMKKEPVVLAPDPPSMLPPASGVELDQHPVPSLEEIGYDVPQSPPICVGGETEGLQRLSRFMARSNWVAAFEKPKTNPAALDTPETTMLSPYLKFGCISARDFFLQLKQIEELMPKSTQPPVSLQGQLLWREFYYTCAAGTPNYDRMEGNPICRQVPWENNQAFLDAWKEARTGYPWIDACMTQLRETGWLHHLARHAVACFLTRGDLWVSWEKGAEVFDELLIDADWALNHGNWMWLSCSCFFYQYFRCYSPVAFPKKYDPDGLYIKKWLPQFKSFPKKYIYEPWKAPIADQKKAGLIVGQDYPDRIVVHETVSKENMTKMAAAYAAHKAQDTSISSKKSKTPPDGPTPGKPPAKKARAGGDQARFIGCAGRFRPAGSLNSSKGWGAFGTMPCPCRLLLV